MPMKNIVVVRPYDHGIRDRMFGALQSAGMSIDAADVIPTGTPDSAITVELEKRPAHVMLVPFHAHRDETGTMVNGLQFLIALSQDRPELTQRPILMPISIAGMAGARLLVSKSPDLGGPRPELVQRILLISEDELDAPDLGERIRTHLESNA